MVRKNKGKKKKSGGSSKAAKVKKNDSGLVRVRNVWPELDKDGRWTCTNCSLENCDSDITDWDTNGICAACGHDEMDEKFAVLIIPIIRQLHDTGWLCGKKSRHVISVDDRSTWLPSTVREAKEEIGVDVVTSRNSQVIHEFYQLQELMNIRAALNDVKPGIGGVATAGEMIIQCESRSYMEQIIKTTEFHTLVDCVKYYFDQKRKALSSISSENNNEDSRTADDKKMGGDDGGNTDQQSVYKSPLTQTDMDTRLVTQYITHLLEELQEVIRSLLSPVSPKRMRSLLGVLESDDITLNPRTVIRAQLQFVQFTDDHRLDNRFSLLREFVNVRSVLKSDGIEMAAAKLEEASHKQHMKAISQEPFFQKLLSDMKRLASVNNSNKSNTDSLKSNTKDMDMETVEPLSVGFNQSWHSDDDKHHRREMIQNM